MLYCIIIRPHRFLRRADFRRRISYLPVIFGALLTLIVASPTDAAPKVAVSIKPLHGLVAGVMDGVGKADLIFQGNSSPHSASFKPSQLRSLRDAALIFWIGEGLEQSIARAIRSVAKARSAMSVDSLPGLKRWPLRDQEDWRDPDHNHRKDGAGQHGEHDPHIWLDTANAAIIVRAVADRLAVVDSANAIRYRQNENRMLLRLTALTQALEKNFAPVRGRRFFVQHDAYQYLEKQFALHPVGVISMSEDRLPGPRHLSELRRRMEQTGATCVFAEPHSNNALARTLAGARGRVVALDIMGAEVRSDALAYFRIMTNLASAMAECLRTAPS